MLILICCPFGGGGGGGRLEYGYILELHIVVQGTISNLTFHLVVAACFAT